MRHHILFKIAALMIVLLFTASASAGRFYGGTWSTAYEDAAEEHIAFSVVRWRGTNAVGCGRSAKRWSKQLQRAGSVNYMRFTNGHAWARGWKQDRWDDSYVDSSDHAFVCTHGSPGRFFFNEKRDGAYKVTKVKARETRWGNVDVETVAIHACQVLNEQGRHKFTVANRKDGVHSIFGFHSNVRAFANVGQHFGYYQRAGYTNWMAWMLGTKKAEWSWFTGALLQFTGRGCNTWENTLYATSCDPCRRPVVYSTTWAL